MVAQVFPVSSRRRPLTRRRLALGAAALPALGLAAGCGGEPPAARRSGPVTIAYLGNLPATHPAGAARLELLREFNRISSEQIAVDLSAAEASTTEAKAKTLAA